MSLPVRGAWIEIDYPTDKASINSSLPVRGAWIEINSTIGLCTLLTSLPVRGAWIEMGGLSPPPADPAVAPRAGSVD